MSAFERVLKTLTYERKAATDLSKNWKMIENDMFDSKSIPLNTLSTHLENKENNLSKLATPMWKRQKKGQMDRKIPMLKSAFKSGLNP